MILGADQVVSALIQLLLAIIASGILVKVLTIRQDRRKIAGDASTSEANAASTLSGAALKMVESAQKSAYDADMRAQHAEENAEECRKESERLWRELNRARWRIHFLEMREKSLEQALLDTGIEIPDRPVYGVFDDHAKPPPGDELDDP